MEEFGFTHSYFYMFTYILSALMLCKVKLQQLVNEWVDRTLIYNYLSWLITPKIAGLSFINLMIWYFCIFSCSFTVYTKSDKISVMSDFGMQDSLVVTPLHVHMISRQGMAY